MATGRLGDELVVEGEGSCCALTVSGPLCHALQVAFKGEHAAGVGGPYRQFFSDICREAQVITSPRAHLGAGVEKPVLPLLVRSPNAQQVTDMCCLLAACLTKFNDYLTLNNQTPGGVELSRQVCAAALSQLGV